MSNSSSYQKLRQEADELRMALLDSLTALEEDGQTVAKRKSAVGFILKSYPLAEAALVELLAERELAKSRSKFSALKKGAENYSSMSVGGGTQGAALTKRMNRLSKGGK